MHLQPTLNTFILIPHRPTGLEKTAKNTGPHGSTFLSRWLWTSLVWGECGDFSHFWHACYECWPSL